MPEQPKQLKVREMVETDIVQGMRLKDAEGWNQTTLDWQFLINYNPKQCLVACDGDQVVSTVTALKYNSQLAWIGMMLVDLKARGRGVGTYVFNSILERLEGVETIKLDATPAGVSVYEKAGFTKEYRLDRMVAQRPSLSGAINDSDSIRRTSNADLAEIRKLDQQAFGVDRPELINYLWKSNPDYSWVTTQNGRITGFAMVRKGTKYHHVGPVIANSENRAKALISKALTALKGNAVLIDALGDKTALIEWLASLGFECQRPLIRMYRGKNDVPGKVEYQFAMTGPEIG